MTATRYDIEYQRLDRPNDAGAIDDGTGEGLSLAEHLEAITDADGVITDVTRGDDGMIVLYVTTAVAGEDDWLERHYLTPRRREKGRAR